ncbi:MAG: hypothetical protein PHD48_01905 [Alphaproteobacteria bacterium]|nr:hypothetical protein [Alphaproteobacteria bacterium]
MSVFEFLMEKLTITPSKSREVMASYDFIEKCKFADPDLQLFKNISDITKLTYKDIAQPYEAIKMVVNKRQNIPNIYPTQENAVYDQKKLQHLDRIVKFRKKYEATKLRIKIAFPALAAIGLTIAGVVHHFSQPTKEEISAAKSNRERITNLRSDIINNEAMRADNLHDQSTASLSDFLPTITAEKLDSCSNQYEKSPYKKTLIRVLHVLDYPIQESPFCAQGGVNAQDSLVGMNTAKSTYKGVYIAVRKSIFERRFRETFGSRDPAETQYYDVIASTVGPNAASLRTAQDLTKVEKVKTKTEAQSNARNFDEERVQLVIKRNGKDKIEVFDLDGNPYKIKPVRGLTSGLKPQEPSPSH